ncbi:hypothetical protein SmJEL517_g03886 [Synchytrium microbalum]|uniref:AAA+ ATPase domain-containing protein n=1 Tax=Synchytrium microbalum TaxID=1806994 RepID=A0A507C6Z5_9FUNG|nr:uncharacterized protein SmJEL517_g03886 [Synchytrium microbalum]TPX33255.1 hypothetical protein SmJEL517_g03886 [Synchytrium microbalum]
MTKRRLEAVEEEVSVRVTRSRNSPTSTPKTPTTPKRVLTDSLRQSKGRENVKPSKVLTPKHSAAASIATARKQQDVIVKEDDDDDLSKVIPVTPKTVKTPLAVATAAARTPIARTPTSIFQEAKGVFRRSSTPSRLVGRDKERAVITQFWQENVFAKRGGSLYISGVPGTGKTALVDEICKSLEPTFAECGFKIHVHKMNCMTIKEPRSIYPKLLELIEGSVVDYKAAVHDLGELFVPTKKANTMHVVILDEIDHLLTRDQEVLYNLFQWPLMTGSRLSLIGIANALDLTERFLPRLKAKDCMPTLLNFVPYQVNEITAIIRERLGSLSPTTKTLSPQINDAKRTLPLMQPAAIEFAARKVVGTGDVRKALDVCRQALEVLETSLSSGPKSPTPASTSSMDVDLMPKVTVQHVAKAASAALNSSNLASTSMIYELNAHQKMVMAALLVCRKKGVESTSGKVYEVYGDLLNKSMSLMPHPYSIFTSMLEGLASSSLVSLARGKGKDSTRSTVVALSGDAEHIEKALLENDTGGRLSDAINGVVHGVLPAFASAQYFYTNVYQSSDTTCSGPPNIVYASKATCSSSAASTPFGCTLQNGVYVKGFCSGSLPSDYIQTLTSPIVSYFGEILYNGGCPANGGITWTYARNYFCVHAGAKSIPVGEGDTISTTGASTYSVNATHYTISIWYTSATCSFAANSISYRARATAELCSTPVMGSSQLDVFVNYTVPVGPASYFYTVTYSDSTCANNNANIIFVQNPNGALPLCQITYTEFGCTLQNGVYVKGFCSETAPPAQAGSVALGGVSFFGQIYYASSCKAGNEIHWTYVRTDTCVHSGSQSTPIGQGDSISSSGSSMYSANATSFTNKVWSPSLSCSGAPLYVSYQDRSTSEVCSTQVEGGTEISVLIGGTATATGTAIPTGTAISTGTAIPAPASSAPNQLACGMLSMGLTVAALCWI